MKSLFTRSLSFAFLAIGLLCIYVPLGAVCHAQRPSQSKSAKKATAKSDIEYSFVSIFALERGVAGSTSDLLVYRDKTKWLERHEVKGGTLEKVAQRAAKRRVWRASSLVDGNQHSIAVAYGYGRGDLKAPVSVQLYQNDLSSGREIYSARSPRSQITFLRQSGPGLFISYFDSKFYTKVGQLMPPFDGKASRWSFSEQIRPRLGMSIDLSGGGLLVGSPYADEEGGTPEVRMMRDGSWVSLPSLRGVRSLSFAQLDSDPRLEILIGDGWHREYGKKAVPRLSMIDYDEKQKKYLLALVAEAKPQVSIEKIFPINNSSGRVVAVLCVGEAVIDLFIPGGSPATGKTWQRKILARKASNSTTNVDAAYLGTQGSNVIVAIYDGQLRLEKIAIPRS